MSAKIPVPNVAFASPAENPPLPTSAACWSPHDDPIGTAAPNTDVAVEPTTSLERATRAISDSGTR